MAKLIKLAKMAGVMHEADHAYSIRYCDQDESHFERKTWCLKTSVLYSTH